MQKLFIILYAVLAVFTISAESSTTQKVKWITSYEEAVNQSNATSKPILLFFTGSDWCSWCHKLEAETLNTQEFADVAGDKFIFVTLDFPSNPKLQKAQNQELKKKYGVVGFPTIVIVDSKGQKIGQVGYEEGVIGKRYGELLMKMVNEYSGYKQKLSSLESQNFSGLELITLYEKAQEFGLFNDIHKIMSFGLQSDQKQFFLIERYRALADEGKMDSKEAINLKKQLFDADASNENFIHYHVAIIDFETLSCLADSHKKPPEYTITPLIEYINKFGAQDKKNLWRLHMIISQVYYDKNRKEEALHHAKLGKEAAPNLVQPEIAIVIKNIEQ